MKNIKLNIEMNYDIAQKLMELYTINLGDRFENEYKNVINEFETSMSETEKFLENYKENLSKQQVKFVEKLIVKIKNFEKDIIELIERNDGKKFEKIREEELEINDEINKMIEIN